MSEKATDKSIKQCIHSSSLPSSLPSSLFFFYVSALLYNVGVSLVGGKAELIPELPLLPRISRQ